MPRDVLSAFFRGTSFKNGKFPRKKRDFFDFPYNISLRPLLAIRHKSYISGSGGKAATEFRFLTIFLKAISSFHKSEENCLIISITNHFSHRIFFFPKIRFIHTFITEIYIAPLQGYYSEALPTLARLKRRVLRLE